MIAISTKKFNLNGNFVFNEHSLSYRDVNRRVTRTKMIDNSVYIDDVGFCVGDNDIVCMQYQITSKQADIFNSVFSLHSKYLAITDIGDYNVRLKKMTIKNSTAIIVFFIESEL